MSVDGSQTTVDEARPAFYLPRTPSNRLCPVCAWSDRLPPAVMSGLVTGTSSEYLGTRPLRHIFRDRPVTFVLGPRGVGKTAVALRLAQAMAAEPVVLDAARLNDELVRCVRRKAWSDAIQGAAVLILDGPEKIAQRPVPPSGGTSVQTWLKERFQSPPRPLARTLATSSRQRTANFG